MKPKSRQFGWIVDPAMLSYSVFGFAIEELKEKGISYDEICVMDYLDQLEALLKNFREENYYLIVDQKSSDNFIQGIPFDKESLPGYTEKQIELIREAFYKRLMPRLNYNIAGDLSNEIDKIDYEINGILEIYKTLSLDKLFLYPALRFYPIEHEIKKQIGDMLISGLGFAANGNKEYCCSVSDCEKRVGIASIEEYKENSNVLNYHFLRDAKDYDSASVVVSSDGDHHPPYGLGRIRNFDNIPAQETRVLSALAKTNLVYEIHFFDYKTREFDGIIKLKDFIYDPEYEKRVICWLHGPMGGLRRRNLCKLQLLFLNADIAKRFYKYAEWKGDVLLEEDLEILQKL